MAILQQKGGAAATIRSLRGQSQGVNHIQISLSHKPDQKCKKGNLIAEANTSKSLNTLSMMMGSGHTAAYFGDLPRRVLVLAPVAGLDQQT